MDSPERVVYIVSDIEKALSFEWLARGLKPSVDLAFILIGKEGTALEKYLREIGVQVYVVSDRQYPGHIRKWPRVFRLLKDLKPAIVHTHLWRANLLGLSASWVLRIKRRIFTRHHAMVHYHEHPSGRKWDRLCNFMATDIIAISKNIEHILVELDQASPQKIHLLHHGFDLKYFENVSDERVSELRRQSAIPATASPIVGVIARYVDWKGIQYVVPAFQQLLKAHPDAHLVLANANGPFKSEIQSLLAALPKASYTEMSFVSDLAALYRLFDIYVHVPVDEQAEAFGQTYVEALICQVPSIFSKSGIAREFILDSQLAMVVPFCDAESIGNALIKLQGNDKLREQLKRNGYEAAQSFSLGEHLNKLLEIYRR
jgi:glycosyltransferase involved in cell wall biosynthesis